MSALPSQSPGWLRVAAISAIAVLVACEIGARLLSLELSPPEGWRDRELARQVARMSSVAEEKQTSLALVGSSALATSIDPPTLRAALERDDWYVAWASGATARLLDPWVREIVQPTLQPEFVVLGLTSYELNDAFTGRDDLVNSYLGSPGRRRAVGNTTPGDRVHDFVARRSALVRYRQYLRSPAELVARLVGRLPALSPPHGVDEGPVRTQRATDVGVYVAKYQVGERQQVALDRLLGELQRDGVKAILVDLPVLESEWIPLHEHGKEDVEAYRDALRTLAATHDVPLFSYQAQFQDSTLFVDPIHLNRAGAELFSRRLANDIRQLTAPGDGPSLTLVGAASGLAANIPPT